MALNSLILLLLLSICAVTGSPLLRQPLSRDSPSPVSSQSSQQCSVIGNSDFYGLGIRIGIYLQWISAFLANWFLHEAVDGNLETNTIFLLAVFVAMIVATAQRTVQSIEIVVLLHLCFGFLFSVLSIWGHRTRSSSGRPIRFPLIGSFFRLSLATAICAYAIWFWFLGVRTLAADGCPPYTFLFAKVNVLQDARIFFQTVSVLIVVMYGTIFIRELLMIMFFYCWTLFWSLGVAVLYAIFSASGHEDKTGNYARVDNFKQGVTTGFKQGLRITFHIFWSWANGKESSGPKRPTWLLWLLCLTDVCIFTTRSLFQFTCLIAFKRSPPIGFPPMAIPMIFPLMKPKSEDAKTATVEDSHSPKFLMQKLLKSKLADRILFAVNGACLVWAIAAVEFSLAWNNVTNVYTLRSTGQLIPLIIGIVGFLRIFHGLSVERSDLRSVDILMGLLDIKSRDPTNVTFSSSGQRAEVETFSLHDGTEAVFEIKVPESSQTVDAIPPRAVLPNQASDLDEQYITVDVARRSVDSVHRDSGSTNRHIIIDSFDEANVDIYKLRDGREVRFAKDFRKSPYNLNIRFPQDSGPVGSSDESSERSPSITSSYDERQRLEKRAIKRTALSPKYFWLFCIFACIYHLLFRPLKRILMSPKVKARLKFAREQFWERLMTHTVEKWKHFESKYMKTDRQDTNDLNEQSRDEDIASNSNLSLNEPNNNTPPAEWPHRRKKDWKTPKLREAFETRSFYMTMVNLSEAMINLCEWFKYTKTAAEMHKITDTIHEAKILRDKRNAGEMSLEEQRDEVLKRYHEVMNKDLIKIWFEEFQQDQSARRTRRNLSDEEGPEIGRLRRAFTWAGIVDDGSIQI